MANFEITRDSYQNPPTKRKTRLFSSCSTDSGINMTSQIESCLAGIAEEGKFVLETSQWSTEGADLVLKVDDLLFPVHRMVLWESSALLRSILQTVTLTSDDDFDLITLQGVNAHDLEDIIPFFYDQHRKIDDLDVLDILRIAEIFEASKVVKRCESYLIVAQGVHPLDLLKIATKFKLKHLKDNAIMRASRLPKIARFSDFGDLELSVQNEILLRLLMNFERVASVAAQGTPRIK